MRLVGNELVIGEYKYFRCVDGSDTCFGVYDPKEVKEGTEIGYESVEGWPDDDCKYQVGRLTCTTDVVKVVSGELKKLLGVKNEKCERDIADDGATSICRLGRLCNVRIRKKYRGQKIAQNLIDLMKKKLRNHIIFLHVESDTPGAAFGLYKKSGFKSFKKNKDYMVYIPENRQESYTKLSEKLMT